MENLSINIIKKFKEEFENIKKENSVKINKIYEEINKAWIELKLNNINNNIEINLLIKSKNNLINNEIINCLKESDKIILKYCIILFLMNKLIKN